MYYRVCERCGAHLDPGERCDCGMIDQIELEMCASASRAGARMKWTAMRRRRDMNGVMTKLCPHCSAVWTLNGDGVTWNNNEPYMGDWHNRYPEDPLPEGNTYCPVCAVASADHAEHMAFIRENTREKDFLAWLLRDATDDDFEALFETLPEELLEVRRMTWAQREEKTPWEIKDDVGAEWAIQQIVDAKEELAAWKEHYARQLQALEAKCHDTVMRMTLKLEAYFDQLPHRVAATQESYNLPSARLIRKQQQPEYIRDDDALLPWITSTAPEYAEASWKIRLGELKKHLTVVDGQAVDAETGEVVPGVTVQERGETFVVSLHDNREA